MPSEDVYKKLNERVKELSCLYSLSKITTDINSGIETMLKDALKIIPQGWQEPDNLSVSIILDNHVYGNKVNGHKGQRAKIFVDDIERGTITVTYPKKREDTFGYLLEEQQLLNQIAREIGAYVNRIEQKEKEWLIQEKLKKDDRLNILGELTAGIAHELNTPLGNIMGYAELLKKTVTKREQQKDLEKIITSSLNAREIVKKLMYFSCEMPTQFNFVKVNKIIHSTVDLLKLRLREKRIVIDTSDVQALNEIRGDELQLSQVFINLIMNAISASSKKGKIKIRTFEANSKLHILVEDFGEGMTNEVKEKIFQPFYTTRKGGTGLGLSVVHGIIQNHGGQIQVESKVGTGSIFNITIPLEKK